MLSDRTHTATGGGHGEQGSRLPPSRMRESRTVGITIWQIGGIRGQVAIRGKHGRRIRGLSPGM